jgi:hypothetical protein
MKLDDARPDLIRALALAAEEHGVPNRFSPAELEAHYGGPAPLTTGVLWSRENCLLRDAWRDEHGLEVTYADRVFSVGPAAK